MSWDLSNLFCVRCRGTFLCTMSWDSTPMHYLSSWRWGTGHQCELDSMHWPTATSPTNSGARKGTWDHCSSCAFARAVGQNIVTWNANAAESVWINTSTTAWSWTSHSWPSFRPPTSLFPHRKQSSAPRHNSRVAGVDRDHHRRPHAPREEIASRSEASTMVGVRFLETIFSV